MLKYREFIVERAGGAVAGKHELVKTNPDSAYKMASGMFAKSGNSLDEDIPEFIQNYTFAQAQARNGHTKRKDMPVISEAQLKDFQRRLANGFLDIRSPYANKSAPYYVAGREDFDGARDDDKVKITSERVPVGKLQPIQEQIYIDKSIGHPAKSVKQSRSFLAKAQLVVSGDLRIIDGHHRWLTAMLIDPKMMVHIVRINLPWEELLKVAMQYSDYSGNKRNK